MNDLQGLLADFVKAELLRQQIANTLGNGDAHVQMAQLAKHQGEKMEAALREIIREEIQRCKHAGTGVPYDI